MLRKLMAMLLAGSAILLISLGLVLATGCHYGMAYPAGLADRRVDPMAFDLGVRVERVAGRGGGLVWVFPGDGKSLLIVAHGNGETIDDWAGTAAQLAGEGIDVMLVEFPGYRGEPGRATPRSVKRAMVRAYDWAKGSGGYGDAKIYGLGSSIGAGSVGELARVRRMDGLVWLAPFTDLGDAARFHGLPGWLVGRALDNRSAAREAGCPILVIHGAHDSVVPSTMGEELAELADRGRILLVHSGHNDLMMLHGERVLEEVLEMAGGRAEED